jgi:hypothetical protein
MNFKDLLEKYKNGSADDEEIKFIEEELEKHEAIEEYLSEGIDLDLKKDITQDNITKETTFIKKSVNKKLRKVIISAVSIVFLILFAIFYIISPAVSSFYYNPSQKTVGKYDEDLYFDLKAFTELNLPGYAVGGAASSENMGFGVYNIYFERINLFTREEKDITAKIKRNMRIGSFIDFFARDYFGFEEIRTPEIEKGDFLERRSKNVISHIQRLNSVSYVSAYITFKDDLTMKELDELIKKYNEKIDFEWAGIRTEAPGKTLNYLSGFNPDYNGGSICSDSPDSKKYPYLQLIDWFKNPDNNQNDWSGAYTKHYISLLKYMNDRQMAVKALDVNETKVDYYKNAFNYIQKNGVKTYGVLVYGEAADLLKFINNEKIKNIELDDVLASKKYIN